MTVVALVADRETADLSDDGPLLLAAFAGLGIGAEVLPWGPGPDWARFDGVVIRTTWDYVLDRPAFLGWAAEVAACTRLANPLDVLVWNTDKRYLRDLAVAGIPTVPTVWVEPGEPDPVPAWDEFVVKPSISAGARLTARYRRGDDIGGHLRMIHAAGATAMLQPYLRSIDAEGETGTYVFGGVASHAIRKGPALQAGQPPADDFEAGRSQNVGPAALDPQLVAFARRAVAAAPGLLYARVDTAIDADGRPILLELEATEPYLFLEHAPAGADRFAGAVARWLTSPGGPAARP